MDKPVRLHETKIPVIVDTVNGPIDDVIDLATMSEDELIDLIAVVPSAAQELVYRDLLAESEETD